MEAIVFFGTVGILSIMAYYFHKTHCVFPEHERYHHIKTKRHVELLEERKVMQTPKPEGKTVKIITDDGYEIEAQVISKKKVDTAEPDYCVGDYILIDGIARAIQKVSHDVVTTAYGDKYKKRAIRASEKEAQLPLKFSEEELKMRDQIATKLIEKLCMTWYKKSDPTDPDGKAAASANTAYQQAEAMIIARRSPQYEHESWKKP